MPNRGSCSPGAVFRRLVDHILWIWQARGWGPRNPGFPFEGSPANPSYNIRERERRCGYVVGTSNAGIIARVSACSNSIDPVLAEIDRVSPRKQATVFQCEGQFLLDPERCVCFVVIVLKGGNVLSDVYFDPNLC